MVHDVSDSFKDRDTFPEGVLVKLRSNQGTCLSLLKRVLNDFFKGSILKQPQLYNVTSCVSVSSSLKREQYYSCNLTGPFRGLLKQTPHFEV